jgi:hypothetical protein
MRAFLFFLVKAHVHGHYRTINGIKKWIDPYEDKRPSAKPKIKTKGKDRKTEDLFDPRMSGDLYDPVAVREARKQIPAKPEKPKTVPVLFVRPDQPDLFGDNDLAVYSKMRNTESEPTQGDSVMNEDSLQSVKATGKQSRGKWTYTVTLPDGSKNEFKSDKRYTHVGMVETGPAAKNPGVVKHIASLESPDEIAAWTEKALKSPAHARAMAVPIELTEAKPPRVKTVTEKTISAPVFDASRIPNGSTWNRFKLEVSSVGRKWIKVKIPGKDYEMQAELNEVSANWKPGDTVSFYGAKHVESDKYGTKTTYYPAPDDIGAVRTADSKRNAAIPDIKKWLGWVEDKAKEGYLYTNGIEKLNELGIKDHPEFQARLDAAKQKAKDIKAAAEAKASDESAKRIAESQSAPKIESGQYGKYHVRRVRRDSGEIGYRVSFEYDPDRVKQIKAIGGKDYNSSSKEWYIGAENVDKLRPLLDRSEAESPSYSRGMPEGWFRMGGGQGYGWREFRVGDTIRVPGETPPRYVTVVSADKKYFRDDGMSFGVGDESGYVYSAVVRPASEEEAAPLRAVDELARQKAEQKKQIATIREDIKARGERPSGMNDPEGIRVHDTQNIYGGGDWFVVGPDWIWYVQNNGMDGDNWAANNVRTGGAGAIGWRVPYDAELAAKLGVNMKPERPVTEAYGIDFSAMKPRFQKYIKDWLSMPENEKLQKVYGGWQVWIPGVGYRMIESTSPHQLETAAKRSLKALPYEEDFLELFRKWMDQRISQ